MNQKDSPTPDDSPMTFAIECRLSPTSAKGRKHPVTIHPDWSVSTPHKLAAERVASAFGGYTSCLGLVDLTLPMFRKELPLLSRDIHLALRRDAQDGWRLPRDHQAAECCRSHRFMTIGSAVSHAVRRHISRKCMACPNGNCPPFFPGPPQRGENGKGNPLQVAPSIVSSASWVELPTSGGQASTRADCLNWRPLLP